MDPTNEPDAPEDLEPSESAAVDPIERAREYGIDISLLHSNLLRTPEERLRLAGRNAEFIRRLRGKARR